MNKNILIVIFALLLIVGQAAIAHAQSATYQVTFQGKWTTTATPGGVPGSAHFSPLIGAIHNDQVTFWSSGGTASAGIESMAEIGGTSTLKSEINASSHAHAVIERSGNIGETATATVDITVTPTYPLVTLVTMIAPSPDWFVGVSGLSLRDNGGNWLTSHSVNLFPYEAGTEDGTEFSLNNAATDPQGTITSIKGTGKFSDEPIATLTFTLRTILVAGYLENPGPASFQSGIGVISGWVCEAEAVEIEIRRADGSVLTEDAAYGTERVDTAYTETGEVVCGDTDNGFGLLFNWNRLGNGEHTVIALVDGEELGRATVRVTTVGEGDEEEFVREVSGECTVTDFPMMGETVTLTWQQNLQNFVILSHDSE